jgi:hypothetical protein
VRPASPEIDAVLEPLREGADRVDRALADNRAYLDQRRAQGIDPETRDLLDRAANSPSAPSSLRRLVREVAAGRQTWDDVFAHRAGADGEEFLASAFRTAHERFADVEVAPGAGPRRGARGRRRSRGGRCRHRTDHRRGAAGARRDLPTRDRRGGPVNGHDVLRAREEIRPRVAPFLEPDESLDVVVPASSRPGRAVKAAASVVWPFFHEWDRYLLVATDRRWLVLESSREKYTGDLRQRARFGRDIEVDTSWVSRFDGFDQPYAIDPIHQLWAVAANDALATRAAGETWDLTTAADRLTAADNDPTTERLGDLVMRAGRFVPRRRR